MVVEGGADFVEGGGEGVVVLVEVLAHAGVLGALAGQDEDGAGGLVGAGVVLGQVGVGLVGAHGVEGLQ